MPTQYWKLTASEVVALTTSGKLSVEDYAKSLLERVDARDETIKAWAYLNRDLIIKSARELDRIPKERRGPLHGVAVGVKDVIYTKDQPTQHKSALYKDSLVPVDAGCIATLRAAGALIFGKTTTTEFAATTLGGPSCNPHDPKRTPGGSSSGSGAAVGDFQVPVALGTQTVGSTIRPGSYNGIVAMKPTWGNISREGLKLYSIMLDTLGRMQKPPFLQKICSYLTNATVYTRSVADMQLLANVFDLKDDASIPREPFKVKGARVAAAKTHVWHKAQPGLVSAWSKALDILRKAGADVEEIALPSEFCQIDLWHKIILHMEGRAAFLGDYRRGKEHMDDFLHEQTENRLGWTKKQLTEAYDGMATLRRQFDEIAIRYDVVLVPSVPDEAPEGITSTGFADFCGPWTILHTPVVQLPGFAGKNGMPIGLSLTGPRFHDQHVLRVAEPIADLFAKEGGWKHELF